MTATRKAGEPILVMSNVTKRFGGLRAVDRATFAVAHASITALIGPNGAGKTTLLDLISGYERPDLGAVRFEGRRIDGLASHRVARRGVVRTFQLTRVFAAMSARGQHDARGAAPPRRGPASPRIEPRGRETRGGRGA